MIGYFFLCFVLFAITVIAAEEHKKNLISLGNGVHVKETWLLNLDRRQDRLNVFKSMAANMSLDFVRFPVVDGHYLKHHQFHKLKIHPETAFNLTFWELQDPRLDAERALASTWQTHLQTYFRIRENVKNGAPDDPVMILEDDAVFDVDARARIEAAGKLLPPDWQVLMLGYKGGVCMQTIAKNLCRARHFLDLTGYIVRNAASANKLISLGNTGNGGGVKTADIYYLPELPNSLRFYLITPRVVKPLYGSVSDIQVGKINGIRGD